MRGGIGSLVGLGLAVGVVGSRAGLGDEFVVALMVFFFVLPVVNGLWDWLSWLITRGLGRRLLASFGGSGGLGQRVAAVVGHGVLDLVLAVALLAAMAFFLAFGFEAYNRIAIIQRGQDLPVFDLGPFLANAADHPWTDGLWLTVMLISTLVPTALHVVALLASPIALVTLPTEKRLAAGRRARDVRCAARAAPAASSGGPGATSRASAMQRWRSRPGCSSCSRPVVFELINLLLGELGEGQTIAHLVLGVAKWGIAAAHVFN